MTKYKINGILFDDLKSAIRYQNEIERKNMEHRFEPEKQISETIEQLEIVEYI